MGLKNTSNRFGGITKLLHWTIFLLFIVEFFLAYRREFFPTGSPQKLQYILLHKSLGVCIFVLALIMILWRHVGTRPVMPLSMTPMEVFAAKSTHFLLYVIMLFQPVSGFLMSSFAGYAVAFFGLFTIPNYLTKNGELSKAFSVSHLWGSYLILALVSLHIIAAFFHQFIKRDTILKRMLPFVVSDDDKTLIKPPSKNIKIEL